MLNGEVKGKGLTLGVLYESYNLSQKDGFDVVAPRARADFRSLLVSAGYLKEATDTLQLRWRLDYKRQEPWNTSEDPEEEFYGYIYNGRMQRTTGTLASTYTPSDEFELVVGAEAYFEHDASDQSTDEQTRRYRNIAGFTEFTYDTFVLMTVGMRAEAHSQFGGSWVPRFSAVKVFDDFHVKALASRAFRAPGHENLQLNPDIQPERLNAFEVEAGYGIGETMFITANGFFMRLEKPILYFWDEATNDEGYINGKEQASAGVEAEFKVRDAWGYATLTYSFAKPVGDIEPSYDVPGATGRTLAFPEHKVALLSSFRLTDELSVNPNAVVTSGRYAITGYNDNDDHVAEESDVTALLNGNLHYSPALVEGLGLTAGVLNALDADNRYIQPYDSDHAPLPGRRREWSLKAEFQRSW